MIRTVIDKGRHTNSYKHVKKKELNIIIHKGNDHSEIVLHTHQKNENWKD